MKYNKNLSKTIIIEAAKKYEKYLNNKHFLIVYQEEGKIKHLCIGFRDMNFLHFTGVQTTISAKQFYSACISGKLSENDFEFDVKGKARQKLMVLSELPDLLFNNCMIGEFVNSGIFIKADYFVGDTKARLSLGIKRSKDILL